MFLKLKWFWNSSMPHDRRLIMTLTRAFLVLLLLPSCPLASADTSPSAPAASGPDLPPPLHKTMNGISYGTFGDFFTKWHFVTARYRKDTGELRFTYANDIAWRTMQKGDVTDYPDGAAFGKVGVMTQDDPAFTSSAVPSGAMRYQIMLREHKKHPETQGWTYAIFLGDHMVHGADTDAEKSAACAACHAVVPNRGYVFSQPMNLSGFAASMPVPGISTTPISFRTVKRADAPKIILDHLPPRTKELRLLEGPVAGHVFAGTLDEILPSLAKEAMRSHMPAALVSKDGKDFSLAFAAPNAEACTVPAPNTGKPLPGRIVTGINTVPPEAGMPPIPLHRIKFCEEMP
jgi:Cytochrome P460